MRNTTVTATSTWLAALVALVIGCSMPGWAVTKGPDAGGYSATDETVYSFADIAGDGGGATILAGADDDTAVLSMPFSFSFYGASYNLLCVSVNGAVYFITAAQQCSALNDFVNTDLSSTVPAGDRPGAFPFWSDLSFQVPGAGSVLYQAIGAPGSRRFVVQWNDAYPQGSPNPVTFQAIFSEGTNAIRFQYKSVDLGSGNPASLGAGATVGIRNAGAPANNQLLQWSMGSPVLADLGALLFSPATGQSPTTTAAVRGLRGLNGWYLRPATVTLSAKDADGAVAGSFYSVDGGGVLSYQTPFAIAGDGAHDLAFYSRDAEGNQEATQHLPIRIDGTGPVVTVAVTAAPNQPQAATAKGTLSGRMTDSASGVNPQTATYVVLNRAGKIVAKGTLTLAADGAYTQAIVVPVPNNKVEPRWLVVVGVLDRAGNPGGAKFSTSSVLK